MNDLNKALYINILNNNIFVWLKVLSYNVSWENMKNTYNKASNHSCTNDECLKNIINFI